MAERLRLSHLVAIVLGLAAGFFWGRWNGSKELARIGRSADSLSLSVDSLTAAIAFRRDTDSHAVETPILRARTFYIRAMSLKDSLALERARTDAAMADTNRVVAESALAVERRTADTRIRALELAYRSQGEAVDSLRARLSYYRDTALTQMAQQLERAQQLLRESLAVPRRKRCGIGASGPFALSNKGAGWGVAAGLSCQL